MRYVVVIENGDANYSACVPDLPGCVAVGDTLEEVKAEIREAIEFISTGCGRMAPGSRRLRADYVEVRSRRRDETATAPWGKLRRRHGISASPDVRSAAREAVRRSGACSSAIA
jgi:hypothetical protein